MSNVIEVAGSPIERKERQQALVPMADLTPVQMLGIAVQRGADLEYVKQLMELQERWEKNQARKAYVAAMAAFKANPPTIVKNKHVEFELKTGGRQSYNHATHDEVTNKIIVALSPHGLSHSWAVRQADNLIFVKCRVTHELGYFEEVELFGPPDTTGVKSPIQQIASTVTLLQRYTLLSVTGLSTEEMGKADTDGRATKPKVTEEQVANLKALLTEVGANEINFLKWLKVDALSDILATNYDACVKAIEAKRHGG
jgi:ERF superfamily